jgi:hypothetical protein
VTLHGQAQAIRELTSVLPARYVRRVLPKRRIPAPATIATFALMASTNQERGGDVLARPPHL